MKSVSPQVSHNGNGNGNGHRKAKGKDVVSQVAHPEPKDGGKLIVLTAPLTETIDHLLAHLDGGRHQQEVPEMARP